MIAAAKKAALEWAQPKATFLQAVADVGSDDFAPEQQETLGELLRKNRPKRVTPAKENRRAPDRYQPANFRTGKHKTK